LELAVEGAEKQQLNPLANIQHELHDRFGIDHITVQLECGTCERSCLQESKNVV
jgi:Co/Zn/Cd efflux system component